MSALIHRRLGRLIGEISRDVYTIRPVSEGIRLQSAERLARELDLWKSNLPPVFGSIRPLSLATPFQRQSNVLRTAYAHAVVYANRSFLLNALTNRNRGLAVTEETINSSIDKCVEAARSVIKVGLGTAHPVPLSTAFWFTQYASFCAAAVLYIYIIQQYKASIARGHLFIELSAENQQLFELAQECQRRLAEEASLISPSTRYSILLEELRQEVHSQLLGGAALQQTMADPPMQHQIQQSAGTVPLSETGVSLATDTNTVFAPQFGLNTDWDTTNWAQLDTWVS